MTMIDKEQLPPSWLWLVISSSCIAAILLLHQSVLLQAVGVAIVGGLAIATIALPWLGVLPLFPLAFAVAVPPQAIGAKEAAFAIMTGTVIAAAVFSAILNDGFRKFLREFGFALVAAIIFFAVNFVAAIREGVGVLDWLRGAVPYAFLLVFVPIAIGLRDHPARLRWLAISIGGAILLFCGCVINYYIAHRMWVPYWYIKVDGDLIRVTQGAALASPVEATGPFVDRITMLLPSSTDTFIPLGVSLGFVVAVFAIDACQRIAGAVLTAVAILAILVSYTRSMLLSPFIAIGVLLVYIVIRRRDRLRFALIFLFSLTIYIAAAIHAFGLEQIWLGRTTLLLDAARQFVRSAPQADKPRSEPQADRSHLTRDDNVNTRVDEYRIAWSMFLDHPVIGNGLGKKHPMTFIRSTGEELHESVGYVHSWPLYALMAGGIIGFLAYVMLLLWPAIAIRGNLLMTISLRAAIATLALYGLFFATARLITFNLLIAAAWGVVCGINAGKGDSIPPRSRTAA
jgi:O-Antigen ligase